MHTYNNNKKVKYRTTDNFLFIIIYIIGFLTEKGIDLETSCVFISLWLKSMKDYSVINQEYVRHFGLNPPARLCVQVPIKNVVKMSGHIRKNTIPRKTMHVQGISHWAPANIGPYSQAIQVSLMSIYTLIRIPRFLGNFFHKWDVTIKLLLFLFTIIGRKLNIVVFAMSVFLNK